MNFQNEKDRLEIRITFIQEIVKPKEDKDFYTRQLGLTVTTIINGYPNENNIIVQALGTEAKGMELIKSLDNFNVGDYVDVLSYLKGTHFEGKDGKIPVTAKNPKGLGGNVNLILRKIENVNRLYEKQPIQTNHGFGGYANQPQGQPNFMQNAFRNNQQNPQSGYNNNQPNQPNQYSQPNYSVNNNDGVDDLPF